MIDVQFNEQILKNTFVLPFGEIVVNKVVRRKIFWEHPPLTP